MKLKKILEKVKNYLFLIQNNEDIKKRKIEKLRDKIEDKILKLDKKIRDEKGKPIKKTDTKEELELYKKYFLLRGMMWKKIKWQHG